MSATQACSSTCSNESEDAESAPAPALSWAPEEDIEHMQGERVDAVDVFSGVGGIALGLHGFLRTVLYTEINPYCLRVLAARMADGQLEGAPVHSDIRTLHLAGAPRIICGGFPCQDISSIGARAGVVDGSRSSLFFEILRLADETPSVDMLFLENVSNIRNNGLAFVLRALHSHGFECAWTMRSAAELGAPHVRARWFCLATRAGGGDLALRERLAAAADRALAEDARRPRRWWSPPGWPAGPELTEPVVPLPPERCARRSRANLLQPAAPYVHDNHLPCCPVVLKAAAAERLGIPAEADPDWARRLHTLGNGAVPAVVRAAFLELLARRDWLAPLASGAGEPLAGRVRGRPPAMPAAGRLVCDALGRPRLLARRLASELLPASPYRFAIQYGAIDGLLARLPTPRRITHASRFSVRAFTDLPTVSAHINESVAFLRAVGAIPAAAGSPRAAEASHDALTDRSVADVARPNVAFVEWVMGLPPGFTAAGPPLPPPHAPTAQADPPVRNGLMLFLRTAPAAPGDARTNVQRWNALTDEERSAFSARARALRDGTAAGAEQ